MEEDIWTLENENTKVAYVMLGNPVSALSMTRPRSQTKAASIAWPHRPITWKPIFVPLYLGLDTASILNLFALHRSKFLCGKGLLHWQLRGFGLLLRTAPAQSDTSLNQRLASLSPSVARAFPAISNRGLACALCPAHKIAVFHNVSRGFFRLGMCKSST